MKHTDYDILKGKEVFSANGESVGSIAGTFHPNMDMPAARGRHYFLLDPGLIKDWFQGFDQVYLPESSIESVSADRVVLNLTSAGNFRHAIGMSGQRNRRVSPAPGGSDRRHLRHRSQRGSGHRTPATFMFCVHCDINERRR